jgi:hypothetical protein
VNVAERLLELASLDHDWDADMFCQHSDASLPHYLPASGPVGAATLSHVLALITTVGHDPYEIAPISASGSGGACALVEWRGTVDHLAVEVGPTGVYGWLLTVDANNQDGRRFYESNRADADEVVRYARTVMTARQPRGRRGRGSESHV